MTLEIDLTKFFASAEFHLNTYVDCFQSVFDLVNTALRRKSVDASIVGLFAAMLSVNESGEAQDLSRGGDDLPSHEHVC